MPISNSYTIVMRNAKVLFFACMLELSITDLALAIGPNYNYRTKLKLEYQYTDYFEYGWPEYVEFSFGENDFSQSMPFMQKFIG